MKSRSFMYGLGLVLCLSSSALAQNSKEKLDNLFYQEKTLKQMASTATVSVALNPLQPSRTMTTSSLTTRSAIWGSPDNITISMLKTDIFDRRYIDSDRFTMADLIEGAYSEKNKDLNDMPMAGMTRPSFFTLDKRGGRYNHGIWSEIYPSMPKIGRTSYYQSSRLQRFGTACCGRTPLQRRNHNQSVTGKQEIRCRIRIKFRNQDTGERRYMEADGSFKKFTVYQPADPNLPLEYYNFSKDKDKIAAFEPPKYGNEGRFFWIEQVFPAEPTFPEGFRYVIMAMVSNSPYEYFDPQSQLLEDSLCKLIFRERCTSSLKITII